ncbi:MAG: MscL family protein [Candidatus Pacebacteria bacterium]|nr:MscL family protein [Candidatus Paceibacterota bacterium]MBP9715889.1 MscL family protein [Candidatus Paceibacterota bacterium]
MREHIKKIRGVSGFSEFIKKQGVVSLAIGFILGGAVSKFVSSLVTDIINPVLNGMMGGVDDLAKATYKIGNVSIHYGAFLNNGIDFIVIALVVYAGVKILRIDQEQIQKIDIGKVGTLGATPAKK